MLGAHDLKLQREAASDGSCCFQKIARIGESPRPHCLREKAPESDLSTKRVFSGKLIVHS